MSSAHLAKGSVEPPRVQGLLRHYSMKFCPYAHRTRLVLNAKGIPHDIVDIDLMDKPEWYFKIHPEGKVPAVLDDDKIIVESLDISDYLDEKYPQNPLYPAEPEAKRRDKELIQKIGPLIDVFNKCVFAKDDNKTPEDWLKEFLPHLEVFEDELAKRGTFFGGEKPNMVDYMLWPWADRAKIVPLKLGAKLPLADDKIPNLRKWRKAMQKVPVCAKLYIEPERMWIIFQSKITGVKPDYDKV